MAIRKTLSAADADGLMARFRADAEVIFMLLCHHPVVEMTRKYSEVP
jgi:hypothetical protein